MLSTEKFFAIFNFRRRNFLFLLIGINFLVHFPFLNDPPGSMHVWRQCNTLAVARNFSEESMNILKPRVDRRGNSEGVTGMQFPSYEYLLAILYKIFGFQTWISRMLSFCTFSIGVVFIYLIFEKLFGTGLIPSIASYIFTWSPELFYNSILALPDVFALTLYLASFYFFLQWKEVRCALFFLLFSVALVLAGLTKLQYLSILAPISIIVFLDLRSGIISRKVAFGFFLVSSACVIICLAWYAYAVHLIKVSGLADFGIEFRPAENLSKGIGILTKNIVSDIPELLLNYAAFTLMIIGVVVFFSKKLFKHLLFLPLAAWAFVLLLYHMIELEQMKMHQYYMMLYVPLLIFPIVTGAIFLFSRKPIWLVVLLVASPMLSIIRIYPARYLKEDKAVPLALYEPSSRKKVSEAVANEDLSIVGPDESGCIYFYFLHKKGFGFENSNQLFEMKDGKMKLVDWIEKGGKYLYTNDSDLLSNEKMKPFIKRIVLEEKSFVVAELHQESIILN